MTENPFDDIPGTTLFNHAQSRLGFHLNQFCMSLMKAANREAFKADERAYLDQWKMTEDQKQAVLDRDWNGMIALGANIYFTAKIAATDGLSFRQIAAEMSGVSEDVYAQMMLDGGRSVEGNRSKKDKR
ncbi:MAG: protocatechuate 4,5-dioxygenase subunit alpha [Alphaproteobacteria bacterium]|nr:protocatechuate 4,5-dioxygenase subunit alpha [Alphaproteobacteria bacterium]MBU1516112.1 protocatechuate 4,5-dioxygenase subunit alpha [Alphaproteobacteria bacterium]MBU2092673.1 protocatechuate 4,5-dioxygenase subunit alpha [Alphaproteobacteria bacterium]MBU2153802.1 protocatechuate 4,5-dioxygenase subunit alpha [Alphaproteobacteria bacterium]MBU2308430.1 protocatechuate 4,5-dioxygenase subunit alpha [Alphaproteobacteria bacterium]